MSLCHTATPSPSLSAEYPFLSLHHQVLFTSYSAAPCAGDYGTYDDPRNDTLVVHFLKKPGGVRYVWGLLHEGVPHSDTNCTKYVWYDNCEGADANHPWCRRHAGGSR